jgi:hypothetical protein
VRRISFVLALAMATALASRARAQTMIFDGDVPVEGDFFVIEFDVPAGIAEIEVRHDDLSATNILDWGLEDPSGFRGYGGGNTEPAIVNEEAASRSYLPGPIVPGRWRVYVGKARIDEMPARYHVEVELRATATLAPQPERRAYAAAPALGAEARWYAGDFHVHSRESGDAMPTLEEIAVFAESRGLDFVMLSEHNTISQLELIGAVQDAHPSLLFVPGIEVTTFDGHGMSLGGTDWIDHRVGFEGATFEGAVAAVHADGALFSINHPTLDVGDLCIGCAWTATVPASEIDGIEIQTGAYSVTGMLFHRSSIAMWEDLVAAGAHVAALGGSDDHRGGVPGGSFYSPIGGPTTMVFAEELSAAAIVEGVRRGRTVVKLESPDDPMLELESPDLGAGTDTIVSDYPTFRVRVTGGAMGASVRLVRSGVPQAAIEVVGDPFEHEVTLAAAPGGEFVRAELLVGGRPRVVTSHLFVESATPGGGDAGPPDAGTSPPSGGGCACRAGARTSSPTLALLALLLLSASRGCRRPSRR